MCVCACVHVRGAECWARTLHTRHASLWRPGCALRLRAEPRGWTAGTAHRWPRTSFLFANKIPRMRNSSRMRIDVCFFFSPARQLARSRWLLHVQYICRQHSRRRCLRHGGQENWLQQHTEITTETCLAHSRPFQHRRGGGASRSLSSDSAIWPTDGLRSRMNWTGWLAGWRRSPAPSNGGERRRQADRQM